MLWLLLLAGIVGLFGEGPAARREITAGRWRVQYERFVRSRTPSRLSITLDASTDTAVVWLDREYAHRMDVQRVIPQPLSVAVGTDRLVYRFLHSGGNPSRIVFELDPQGPGRVVGRVGGTGADRIDISQIVYP